MAKADIGKFRAIYACGLDNITVRAVINGNICPPRVSSTPFCVCAYQLFSQSGGRFCVPNHGVRPGFESGWWCEVGWGGQMYLMWVCGEHILAGSGLE